MSTNKRWTDKEVSQIREDKKILTIRGLEKTYGLTKGQILYALYHYKLEKARPAFFSYERWFGAKK